MFRVPVLCLLVAIGLQAPAQAEYGQEARFTTEDGVEIVGTFLPAEVDGRAPVVILLHMYNSNRHAWKPLTKACTARRRCRHAGRRHARPRRQRQAGLDVPG